MIPSPKQLSQKPWYVRLLGSPLAQIALAAILLANDFVSGPLVQLPIAFIIPVVLAAQFSNSRLSYVLAVIQPLVRFAFVFIWDTAPNLTLSIVNTVIRVAVLLTIAFFINRTVRLSREVQRLEGLLPICSYCKKIRTEQKEWQHIETYISKHSQADFTHGICHDCAQKHFGTFINKPRKT